MNSSELVTSPVPPALADEKQRRGARSRELAPWLAVAALTIVGAVLRVAVAHQSLFADELSTYWISATHGLGGVLSLLYSSGRIHHAEITPPLSFLATWVSTRFGHSAELLRAPALLAGTATIPLIYLLGLRTIGRRAALVATALATFAPFMIYYSSEARAYGLMMFLVVGSTLSMLIATDTGRRRWWALYAVSSAAAFYTHYTCAFVLGAQFLWLLWAHPHARRPALLANVAAAALVIPWIPGLVNDFTSPTVKILAALSPFDAFDVRIDLEHWAVGYPYTFAAGLGKIPGTPALLLLGGSALLAGGGLIPRLRRRSLQSIDRRVLLVVLLALAAPLGDAVVSATGNHILIVRNLAASWPYLAFSGAAALSAALAPMRYMAAGLAIVAFALGAAKMLSPRYRRPDYGVAAAFVARGARPGDVVIDETGGLSPGPTTGLDVSLTRRLPIIRALSPAERDHPFGFSDPIVPLSRAVSQATAAAHGHRIFVVFNQFTTTDIEGLSRRLSPATPRFRDGYRLVERREWPGIGATLVSVYQVTGAAGG